LTAANSVLVYWYFHLPNYVLAALMYTCVGRLLLSLVFPSDARNYIWRAFVSLTDPVLRLVGWITPAIVPSPLLLVFAGLWLLVARMAFFVILFGLGLAPTVS
jgi:hypothetical protein